MYKARWLSCWPMLCGFWEEAMRGALEAAVSLDSWLLLVGWKFVSGGQSLSLPQLRRNPVPSVALGPLLLHHFPAPTAP